MAGGPARSTCSTSPAKQHGVDIFRERGLEHLLGSVIRRLDQQLAQMIGNIGQAVERALQM